MFPLVVSLLLFLFWTVTGRALLVSLRLRVGVLRSWLLAPGVGLSVMVLALMIGNQAGWPIHSFAWPLTAALAVSAMGLLLWRRPILPWRSLSPFFLFGLFFFLWTSWPAFKFGFNWISYVNQDFANYCLSAQRFRDFGFYRAPTVAELGGRDYAQWFWFMDVASLARFGADQTVAWISALSGANPIRVFMPAIIALGAVQVFAAAGLVLHAGRWRRQARCTAMLLAFSPLFMLGCLYQLFAQVGGLALMLTLLALVTMTRVPERRRALAMQAIPSALVGAALGVYYPEVIPFVILSLGVYAAVLWLMTRRFPALYFVRCEYAFVGVILLLRHNLFSCVYMLLHQFRSTIALHDLSMSVFPFFLIPSGLADLFGLQAESADLPDPTASILILAGAVLLLTCVFAAARQVRRPLPFACLMLVQFLLALKLFHDGEDFGLYKLAMFIQPALMAALAFALLDLPGSRLTAPLAAAALFLLTVPAALSYTRAATGSGAGGFIELRGGSQLVGQAGLHPSAGAHWASGIDNIVAVELAANLYRGTDIRFLSRDFFSTSPLFKSDWFPLMAYPHRQLFDYAFELIRRRDALYTSPGRLFEADFTIMREADPTPSYLELPSQLGLFNKAHLTAAADRLFSLQASPSAENLLVFIHSSRGLHYYSYHYSKDMERNIAFFQQEPDFYSPGGACNAIGRFLLLRIQNPTSPFYLEYSLSNTVMGAGRTQLPRNAAILAGQTVSMNLVGNGAAHRIVGPITPVWRDRGAFIAVDLRQPTSPAPFKRSGLKNLYHSQVGLDYRWLVAYARDFSALSAAERDRLPRPRRVRNFPRDLVEARGLEFSGIYEDGWVSQEAEFVLGHALPGEALRLRGYVPILPGRMLDGDLVVSINDQAPLRLGARRGSFDWIVPVSSPGKITRVHLRFTAFGPLPNGDDRPVGAKLELIEIAPPPLAPSDFATAGAVRPAAEGVDQDGWAEVNSAIQLVFPPTAGGIEMELECPGWRGAPSDNALRLSVDGGREIIRTLKPGRNVIKLAIEPGGVAHRLNLKAAKTFRLPAPDGRERAFRLLSLAEIPAAAGSR